MESWLVQVLCFRRIHITDRSMIDSSHKISSPEKYHPTLFNINQIRNELAEQSKPTLKFGSPLAEDHSNGDALEQLTVSFCCLFILLIFFRLSLSFCHCINYLINICQRIPTSHACLHITMHANDWYWHYPDYSVIGYWRSSLSSFLLIFNWKGC